MKRELEIELLKAFGYAMLGIAFGAAVSYGEPLTSLKEAALITSVFSIAGLALVILGYREARR